MKVNRGITHGSSFKKSHPISRSIRHGMMSRCPYLCSNKYSPSSPLTGLPHPPQDRGVGSLEQRRPHAYIENIHLRHEKGYYLSASRSPPISINKEEASYVLEPATHRAWCPVRHLSLLSKGARHRTQISLLNMRRGTQ